jgi:hypothetical protein
MVLIPFSQLRTVSDISEQQLHDIEMFMRGAVYCWIKNHPDRWFAVHDLVGGLINDWEGTPLLMLRDLHDAQDPPNEAAAHDEAGRALGWIVKTMLHREARRFETRRGDIAREYRWIQGPAADVGAEPDDQTDATPDDDRP